VGVTHSPTDVMGGGWWGVTRDLRTRHVVLLRCERRKPYRLLSNVRGGVGEAAGWVEVGVIRPQRGIRPWV
jgi:hypothetical protein